MGSANPANHTKAMLQTGREVDVILADDRVRVRGLIEWVDLNGIGLVVDQWVDEKPRRVFYPWHSVESVEVR